MDKAGRGVGGGYVCIEYRFVAAPPYEVAYSISGFYMDDHYLDRVLSSAVHLVLVRLIFTSCSWYFVSDVIVLVVDK